MMPEIIFDLDGTLIDSAPAILAGFQGAFASCGVVPQRPLTADVIGPPLMDTLAVLAGANEPEVLQPLAEAFKANYDQTGYKQTTVFNGVNEMLVALAAAGHHMHIATNKRIVPTRRIITHLGWDGYFDGVYALDVFEPPLKSKAAMLGEILARRNLDPKHAVYIGDRQEDGEAARVNGIPFLLAAWGYDGVTEGDWTELSSPAHLMETLARL